MNINNNSNVSFCGKMNMTKGMVYYKEKGKDNAIAELNEIGMYDARGNADKLDGKPMLDTNNIKKISDYGISYYLPKSGKEVFLRFDEMKLKQSDYDHFLLAYNAVKDNNVEICV